MGGVIGEWLCTIHKGRLDLCMRPSYHVADLCRRGAAACDGAPTLFVQLCASPSTHYEKELTRV